MVRRLSSFSEGATAMKLWPPVTCWPSHPCSCRVLPRAVLSESYCSNCASAFCLTLSTNWSNILLNSRMKNGFFLLLCHQVFCSKIFVMDCFSRCFPSGREGAGHQRCSASGICQHRGYPSSRQVLARSRQSLLATFSLRVRVRSSVVLYTSCGYASK